MKVLGLPRGILEMLQDLLISILCKCYYFILMFKSWPNWNQQVASMAGSDRHWPRDMWSHKKQLTTSLPKARCSCYWLLTWYTCMSTTTVVNQMEQLFGGIYPYGLAKYLTKLSYYDQFPPYQYSLALLIHSMHVVYGMETLGINEHCATWYFEYGLTHPTFILSLRFDTSQ